jgi:hypothetical protein
MLDVISSQRARLLTAACGHKETSQFHPVWSSSGIRSPGKSTAILSADGFATAA